MPIARVRVAINTKFRYKRRYVHKIFLRAAPFAYTNRFDLSHVSTSYLIHLKIRRATEIMFMRLAINRLVYFLCKLLIVDARTQ